MFSWIRKKKNQFACQENQHCFIAFSCNDEGNVSFDFGFHDGTLESFATLFTMIHTGTFHEDMGNAIVENLHKHGKEDLAHRFMELCEEKINEFIEDDEEPVIQPTDVFRNSEDLEEDDE